MSLKLSFRYNQWTKTLLRPFTTTTVNVRTPVLSWPNSKRRIKSTRRHFVIRLVSFIRQKIGLNLELARFSDCSNTRTAKCRKDENVNFRVRRKTSGRLEKTFNGILPPWNDFCRQVSRAIFTMLPRTGQSDAWRRLDRFWKDFISTKTNDQFGI